MLGVMHSAAFVFDLMEPERPNVDRELLGRTEANLTTPSETSNSCVCDRAEEVLSKLQSGQFST